MGEMCSLQSIVLGKLDYAYIEDQNWNLLAVHKNQLKLVRDSNLRVYEITTRKHIKTLMQAITLQRGPKETSTVKTDTQDYVQIAKSIRSMETEGLNGNTQMEEIFTNNSSDRNSYPEYIRNP